jgi:molecular chaperone GrpE
MEHQTGCTMDDAELSTGQERAPDQGGENCLTECPSCEAELEKQKTAYAELNDQFLRLAADFENFKKRSARERELFVSLANERFVIDILEVLDNFERALQSDDTHLREGVNQIQQLLHDRLLRNGITPVDPRKKQFNPAEHEAVAHIASDEPEGSVTDVIARGYRMNDKVIRYAKVAVSKGNQKDQEV